MTTVQRGEYRTSPSVDVDDRTWVHAIARVGIASRGIIYLLSAYLAFDIARHGSAPTETSSTGALQEARGAPRRNSADDPAGVRVGLLWIVADA